MKTSSAPLAAPHDAIESRCVGHVQLFRRLAWRTAHPEDCGDLPEPAGIAAGQEQGRPLRRQTPGHLLTDGGGGANLQYLFHSACLLV
jgi:hypothetical protein